MATTTINYIDNSDIGIPVENNSNPNSPLFIVASTFDKGPEDLRIVEGDEFYDLYANDGKVHFAKHGEANLHCRQIIDNGGRLLIKRLVADDATLANIVISAKVEESQIQKINDLGELLYIDPTTNEETTEAENSDTGAENEPVMIRVAKLTWTASSVNGAKSFKDVYNAIAGITGDTLPIFFFTDNGRGGEVTKAIKLTPDYGISAGLANMFYAIRVFEGTTMTDNNTITINPDVVYGGNGYRIDEGKLDQVKGEMFDQNYLTLIERILDILNDGVVLEDEKVTANEVIQEDLLFGYDPTGDASKLVTVSTDSVALNSEYGIELKGGSNGSFGSTPIDSDHRGLVDKKLIDFYNGDIDESIYDVDNYRVSACFDANYSQGVKDAIANYMLFRNDGSFFRHLGLDLNSFVEIKVAKGKQKINNFIISDYSTSYMIHDPETDRLIKVSMFYDFSAILTRHLLTTPFNPTAGIANGFVLESAIEGTLSFVPLKKPKVDYKKAMKDLRVNYASVENGEVIVQSLFTTNRKYSQLSYISNVLSMQHIGREVAKECPGCRFVLTPDVTDFSVYQDTISKVLEKYQGSFQRLELVYTANPSYILQKTYYAAINFSFANWAEDEIFDLVANPMQITVSESDIQE